MMKSRPVKTCQTPSSPCQKQASTQAQTRRRKSFSPRTHSMAIKGRIKPLLMPVPACSREESGSVEKQTPMPTISHRQ